MARVLIACETSGIVREAFRSAGHQAYSLDLLPSDDQSPNHIQDDVLNHLNDGWDLLICHPPCTYLSASGLHWNTRRPGRAALTEQALDLVRVLLNAYIPRICLENPIGCISSQIRKPDQIIQPHQFGHDASKATCLWLKNLPVLTPTSHIAPRIVNGRPRWANQTDSGQNRLSPSPDRWKLRSQTYSGIAQAFVDQWGPLLDKPVTI